jgi:hypothetical protein
MEMTVVVQETIALWKRISYKTKQRDKKDGGEFAMLEAWATDILSQVDEERAFRSAGLGGLIAGVHP